MTIDKLQKDTLEQAMQLRDKVFPILEPLEKETLEASIYKKRFIKWYDEIEIENLEYWTAINKDENVTGLIGLYTHASENKRRVWLGWYCVNPLYRDLSIGSQLLEFAILHAKKQGYKELHLYTTLDEEYAKARYLYEKRGFKLYKHQKSDATLYYKLSLSAL